jgi:hypothetical protein
MRPGVKPFNVTLVHPAGYVHALALAEVVDYLHHMLVACGFAARATVNEIAGDAHNIVVCPHLLAAEHAAALPADTILFNSEQLADDDGWHFASGVYRGLLERFHVWDYSLANLARLGHDRAAFIPLHYCAALARAAPVPPGDALVFYGAVTPHRQRILHALVAAGVPLTLLFGVYGAERDRAMLGARAVLNLHKHAANTFEPVRCFYPLINGKPVISEEVVGDPTADAFRDAMFMVPPARFVDEVAALLADPVALHTRAARFRARTAEAEIRAAVAHYTRTTGGPVALHEPRDRR